MATFIGEVRPHLIRCFGALQVLTTEFRDRVLEFCRNSLPPEALWRDYNRRADMENRIAELKHDLGADDFCMQEFFGTEAAFRSILPATVQSAWRIPARQWLQNLSPTGHRLVLHLSASWGGLKPRIPLLQNVLSYGVPTSPKLDSGLAT